MRQQFALRLLSGAAFAAAIMLGGQAIAAAGNEKPATEETQTFDATKVNSFSGAFLAARTADVDHDYPNAITLYRKALELEPANTEIRERLMLSLLMSGDFDGALPFANELKTDEGVERITTIVRGLDDIRNRKFAEAEKLLTYKGSNDLDRITHTLLAAWARVGAGKGKEALTLVRGMKGPAWFKVFTDYHLGAMALVSGDINTARSSLTSAITNDDGVATTPDTFMRAIMALARLEASQGNKQKALDTIAVGDRLISNYAPLKALRQSIEAGDKPDQQVTTATEGAAAVLFSVGGALNRQGAEEMVSLYLHMSHALDPKSADTLILLGGIAEKLEQPKQAIALYEKVPADSPMRRISELQLGLTLAQTGEVDKAREHLKNLIASDPSDLRSYLAYGSVLSDAKDYKAMAENYDKAVAVIGPIARPADWTIFFQQAISYERLKQWDKAEPAFRKSLELNPEQPQVLNYLGYSFVDMNRNLDEGMAMIKKAVDARPDDGYIVDSLGWAYYRLGQFEEAVTELERAVQLRAGDAAINDHLGDAYWRVGRKLEANYQWKRALTMEPEEAEIPKIKEKIENGLPPAEPIKRAETTVTPPATTETQTAMVTPPANPAPATPAAAETPAADAAIAAPKANSYTVNAGDTLWKIANDALGDGDRVMELIRANPSLRRNPNRIFPGQVLDLPGTGN
ncbi:tetratricopeptide repeat protein [Neorhizobium sp. JUb45]|uniref:tetratricopeptide repeat protein n=1 Tax=Neorhizobium sp. JUb45 TaxID=2485113 RepID=UPI00104A68B2|nr:tetratricopeptide repeat protein [Neorhizobium sp. JUb45]TCR04166.1 Tfp pilus assembly protein PilF [Neorhizobium sp. JUb45]